MKLLQITPRAGTRLYGAMVKKQAEIHRAGRGTFMLTGRKRAKAARWSHVRYKGAIDLAAGDADAVAAKIRSPQVGDETRLLSSFLGWLDRHFGDSVSSVNIQYEPSAARRRH